MKKRARKIKKCAAVYKIICTVNNKLYIGSSINAYSRHLSHFNSLRRGAHLLEDMQEDFNLHGEGTFAFEIIKEMKETDSKYRLISLERKHIQMHNPEVLYNRVVPILHNSLKKEKLHMQRKIMVSLPKDIVERIIPKAEKYRMAMATYLRQMIITCVNKEEA